MDRPQFPEYSIERLLKQEQYQIPRYQRNYAWTEEHIKQLIDDVLDSAVAQSGAPKPYYIGTLVVYPHHKQSGITAYEVIDGQQRLTTLTLLASYLTYPERSKTTNGDHWYLDINLDFESRKRSTETLKVAHNGSFHDNGKKVKVFKHYTEEIVDAYEIIQRILPERCNERKMKEQEFANYLFNHVKICRVDVPKDTDLNHYFEIMNNRGEQLEKHEVLKARLLNKLPAGKDQLVFNKIWEACSSLDRYIQYGFPKSSRRALFGRNWNVFKPKDENELFDQLFQFIEAPEKNKESSEDLSLTALISKAPRGKDKNENKEKEEESERFSSIINFQNLLPHVLSIFLSDGTVPLDDKQLLESFRQLEEKGATQIKRFGYALLKIRFLFDQNIIKRDATEDEREWSLKELHLSNQDNPSYRQTFSKQEKNDDLLQRKITLLQSMFHVSIPSRPYKYWLQGTLRFLYNATDFSAESFQNALYHLAQAFVYNRFLSSTPLEYEEMIFQNEGMPVVAHDIDPAKTRYGQIENILVFNFIDYLLWLEQKDADDKIRNFVFTFRSSVEHYFPQNPIDGNPLENVEALHSIGNLCLISHSKNSMLRHHLPKAKAEYYLKQSYIDSIVQHIMLNNAEKWSAKPNKAIRKHNQMVMELLKKNRP
jgi:uncharacterized protein with ParB-like and HNH nuclease domain